MTEEVPNECENVFCCRSACGSAPAYGSEVLVCYSAYPALIPRRTLCASGTDGANSAAPPALDSGRGWCSVAPGCIFERGIEARRSLGIGVIIPLRLLSHLCALCGENFLVPRRPLRPLR